MPAPLKLAATVASPGYAAGRVHRIERQAASYAPSGSADTEAARLSSAIAQAGSEIATLIEANDSDSAAILEFQAAMLEDETLAEAAFTAIASGTDAATAWREALAPQVAEYEDADDEYFRARSADLRDIRDRVLDALGGAVNGVLPAGSVLVGSDISPTVFLSANWSEGGGVVLEAGSARSHVAMLARARGCPMLVGTGRIDAAPGDRILIDGEHGSFTLRPGAAEDQAFETARELWRRRLALADARAAQPAVSRDDVTIAVMVNIAEPRDVETIDIATCDGVGLMRTEFLFSNGLPDEETQFRAYTSVLKWAGKKPVVIRTVDAGGDKPVPGFTVPETNPFLGLRGIRLSLARPDVFRVQIRALLRAAEHGTLKVMLPMVTVAGELAAARALFVEEASALGLAVPPIGIMVEVPAVALAPELFSQAAFFSIGSNDLTQYAMAAARDNGAVSALNDVLNPGVMRLIASAVRGADDLKIPISICGDAAGDGAAIPSLLSAGLRTLSVAPAQLAQVKDAIRAVDIRG
jgi:phosphoenolpyruvate-protein phosphotransferase (PTS system enzyme I)